jgi:hypothetical protein
MLQEVLQEAIDEIDQKVLDDEEKQDVDELMWAAR